jgi:predicted TIM-barrel fold metal-dependent hydrolase
MERADLEIIDMFTHIAPLCYAEALDKAAWHKVSGSMGNNPRPKALVDVNERFRLMEKLPRLRHVLTGPQPPLEDVVDAKTAAELARICNDEIAAVCYKYPDKFIGVANIPMNNIEATLKETERAIKTLNFKGVQVFTPSRSRAIDGPDFLELYGLMAKYDLPIWIHPTGEAVIPDYPNEDRSKYEINWSLGWPYQTSLAMARLVYSGVFEKYPNLNFITHHLGAMIPFFAHRLCAGRREPTKKSCNEQFKMFYADTAVFADTLTLQCGYAYFGAERTVFATDAPYGGPEAFNRAEQTLAALESLKLPEAALKKILSGNARRIMHLD